MYPGFLSAIILGSYQPVSQVSYSASYPFFNSHTVAPPTPLHDVRVKLPLRKHLTLYVANPTRCRQPLNSVRLRMCYIVPSLHKEFSTAKLRKGGTSQPPVKYHGFVSLIANIQISYSPASPFLTLTLTVCFLCTHLVSAAHKRCSRSAQPSIGRASRCRNLLQRCIAATTS